MEEPADLNLDQGRSDTALYAATTVGTLMLLMLIGWLLLSSQAADRARDEASAQEVHTLNILNANAAILRAVQDSETGQRGYLLTGSDEFLGPYESGRKALPVAIAQLRTLTSDNPDVTAEIERLERLAADGLSHAANSIVMRQGNALEGDAIVEHLRRGKIKMDGLRQALADIERDERDLLSAHQAASKKASAKAENWRDILVVCTILLSLACAIAIFAVIKAWRLSRERRSLTRTTFQLSEGRRLLQAIMDSSPDAIFVKDRRGNVLFANTLMREIAGRPLEELKGVPLLPANDEQQRLRMIEAERAVLDEGEVRQIEQNVQFNGSRIFVTEKTPWLRDGKVVGIVGIAREITDERTHELEMEAQVTQRTAQLQKALDDLHTQVAQRQNAEAALRQMQKLDSLGQLTGGIAHDFNNMLSIIMGSLAMARRRIPGGSDPKLTMAIEHAEEGASRAADLTARLLAFARQQPLDAQPVEVNALLKRTAKLLSRSIGGQISLEMDLDPDAGWIKVDGPQLENALVNLAVNARDAMRDGGTLTISSRVEGAEVAIRVSDTGEGMPPEISERVFEPFFTTKAIGKGTGLGLSQVHGFVTQSGGTVAVESRPGNGTAITLRIPAIDAPDTSEEAFATGDGLHANGHATILLVEDEPLIRKATEEELRAMGYDTLTAANASEALELLDGGHSVDLMLTDVAMPEMDGHTLAREARRKHPGLRILLTSGHDSSQEGDADLALLPKPYLAADLASAIQASLDEGVNGASRN